MYSQEWLIGVALAAAAAGIIVGLIVGRFTLRSKHAAELEQELDQAKESMQTYKAEVFQQFGDTAAKFNKLNESYADLHQQLASSAAILCADMPNVPLLGSSPPTGVIEGEAQTEPPADNGTTTTVEPNAEPAEQAEELAAQQADELAEAVAPSTQTEAENATVETSTVETQQATTDTTTDTAADPVTHTAAEPPNDPATDTGNSQRQP